MYGYILLNNTIVEFSYDCTVGIWITRIAYG